MKKIRTGICVLGISLLLNMNYVFAFNNTAFNQENETSENIFPDSGTELNDESGLEPSSVTGDTGFEEQYPAIEKQVEEQLKVLSNMSTEDVEKMIADNNRQINYSVRDVAVSMYDSTILTPSDDTTMAMVKMLRNWYAVMTYCGEFQGVEEYSVDNTDNTLNMVLLVRYSESEKEKTIIHVKFTYDLTRNTTLLNWSINGGFFSVSEQDNGDEDNIWKKLEDLEARVAEIENREQ